MQMFMDKKKIALGTNKKVVAELVDEKLYENKMKTTEGQFDFLRSRVETLESLVNYLYHRLEKGDEDSSAYDADTEFIAKEVETPSLFPKGPRNKDGIPTNTILVGTTLGRPYILTVNSFNYNIGTKIYDTLSAAAEGVTGNRRSGWSFWRTSDGRTVKEAFGHLNKESHE